jgi:hypothetical protein
MPTAAMTLVSMRVVASSRREKHHRRTLLCMRIHPVGSRGDDPTVFVRPLRHAIEWIGEQEVSFGMAA